MFDRWQNIHPTENTGKHGAQKKRSNCVEDTNIKHNLSRSEFGRLILQGRILTVSRRTTSKGQEFVYMLPEGLCFVFARLTEALI